MITETELQEINDFIQENRIRGSFCSIMEHVKKLKPLKFEVNEYADTDGKTFSILFEIWTESDDPISGKVCYDWCSDINPELKNKIIVELWWGGEDYYLFSGYNNIIRCKNWLTLLLGKAQLSMYGSDTYEQLKAYRKLETLVPIE